MTHDNATGALEMSFRLKDDYSEMTPGTVEWKARQAGRSIVGSDVADVTAGEKFGIIHFARRQEFTLSQLRQVEKAVIDVFKDAGTMPSGGEVYSTT